jgi:hypothetical protein
MFPWFQPSKKIPNAAMKLTQKVSCEPVIPSQIFRAMMGGGVDCEVTPVSQLDGRRRNLRF